MKKGSWIVLGALVLAALSFALIYWVAQSVRSDPRNMKNSLMNKAIQELGTDVLLLNNPKGDINFDGIPDLVAVQIYNDHSSQTESGISTHEKHYFNHGERLRIRRLIMYQLDHRWYRRFLDIKPDGIFTLDASQKVVPVVNSVYAKFGYESSVSDSGVLSLYLLDSLGKPASDEISLKWNKSNGCYSLLQ